MTDTPTPAAAIVTALASLGVQIGEEAAAQVADRLGAVTVSDARKFGLLPHIAKNAFDGMVAEFNTAAVAKSQTVEVRAKAYLSDRGFDLNKIYGQKKLELYERARAAVLAMDTPPPSESERVLANFNAQDNPSLLSILNIANARQYDSTGGNPQVTGERKITRAELPPGPLSPTQKLAAANSLTGIVPKLLRQLHTTAARLATLPQGADRMATESIVQNLRAQLRIHGVSST